MIAEMIRRLLDSSRGQTELEKLPYTQLAQHAAELFAAQIEAKLYPVKSTDAEIKPPHHSAKREDDGIELTVGLSALITKSDTVLAALHLIGESGKVNVQNGRITIHLTAHEAMEFINRIKGEQIVLNSAVYWNQLSRQVEKPLMKTLCLLFQVPEAHYNQTRHLKPARRKALNTVDREVDFFLFGNLPEQKYKCEVKLMGKGNPESADGAFARKAKVFIADKLSEMNKQQATDEGIEWVELRDADGYKRFTTVLKNLDIPYTPFEGDTDELNRRLDEIFKIIFSS